MTVRLTSNLTLLLKCWLFESAACAQKNCCIYQRPQVQLRLISNKHSCLCCWEMRETKYYHIFCYYRHISHSTAAPNQSQYDISMTLITINVNLFGQNWTSHKDLIHLLIPFFQDMFQKQSRQSAFVTANVKKARILHFVLGWCTSLKLYVLSSQATKLGWSL